MKKLITLLFSLPFTLPFTILSKSFKLASTVIKSNQASKVKDKNTKTLQNNVLSNQTKTVSMQVLESMEVMQTTKNLDTLQNRYYFFMDRIIDLDRLKRQFEIEESTPRYFIEVQRAIDDYKSSYYDREIGNHQITILNNPDTDHNNILLYYDTCLMECYKRIRDFHESQITKMKQEKAIQDRRVKILETAKEVRRTIKSHKLSPDFITFIDSEIEIYKNKPRNNLLHP